MSRDGLEVVAVTREDGSTYEVVVPTVFRRRFRKLCSDMAKLIEEFRKHAPDGSVYLEEDNPHLMVGPSHGSLGGHRERALPDNVYASGDRWHGSGGGGW